VRVQVLEGLPALFPECLLAFVVLRLEKAHLIRRNAHLEDAGNEIAAGATLVRRVVGELAIVALDPIDQRVDRLGRIFDLSAVVGQDDRAGAVGHAETGETIQAILWHFVEVGDLLGGDLLNQSDIAALTQATCSFPEVDPRHRVGLLGRAELVEDRLFAERMLVEDEREGHVRPDLLIGRQELLLPQVANVDVTADIQIDVAAGGRYGRRRRGGCRSAGWPRGRCTRRCRGGLGRLRWRGRWWRAGRGATTTWAACC
jgi:hypothetical protein